jgi:hypothetical protein
VSRGRHVHPLNVGPTPPHELRAATRDAASPARECAQLPCEPPSPPVSFMRLLDGYFAFSSLKAHGSSMPCSLARRSISFLFLPKASGITIAMASGDMK